MELIRLWKDSFIAVVVTAVLVSPATWAIAEIFRVNPLNQKIGDLKEQATKYEQYISKLSASYEFCRQQGAQLLDYDKAHRSNAEVYQSNLQQCQDTIESWRKHSSELQNKVTSYETNCDILSKIRELEERKSAIDSYLKLTGFEKQKYETWKRESEEYHARIVDLQKELVCIPK
jgi:chromosome segregation ATPase